jgi:YD repeat-containing protein
VITAGIGCTDNNTTTALLNMAYGYDAVGNVTGIGDRRPLNQGMVYAYDDLDRLKSYSVAGTVQETYTLDAIGNLTWKTGVGAYAYTASGYDSVRPHAVNTAGAGANLSTYVYDPNGNMTSRIEVSGTQRVTYTQGWDEENRLVTVTVALTSPQLPALTTYMVTFGYDADGQLARRTTWQGTTITQVVVYLGPAYEVNATTGVTTSYYFFGGQRVAMRQGATVYWLHGDHLGSASLTTSGSGQIVSQQWYKPYGQTRWISGTIPTDWRFTDQWNA